MDTWTDAWLPQAKAHTQPHTPRERNEAKDQCTRERTLGAGCGWRSAYHIIRHQDDGETSRTRHAKFKPKWRAGPSTALRQQSSSGKSSSGKSCSSPIDTNPPSQTRPTTSLRPRERPRPLLNGAMCAAQGSFQHHHPTSKLCAAATRARPRVARAAPALMQAGSPLAAARAGRARRRDGQMHDPPVSMQPPAASHGGGAAAALASGPGRRASVCCRVARAHHAPALPIRRGPQGQGAADGSEAIRCQRNALESRAVMWRCCGLARRQPGPSGKAVGGRANCARCHAVGHVFQRRQPCCSIRVGV